jgi:ABC-type sugar transport system permease subunit
MPSPSPPSKGSASRRKIPAGRREAVWAFWLLAPAAAVLAAIVAVPMLGAVYASLFNDPIGGPPRFIGLRNYAEALTSAEFWAALRVTFLFAATSVALETLVGLMLALLMHGVVAGRALVRATVLAPWTIPSAIAAVLWAWMLQPPGIVNHLLGIQVLWTGQEWASKGAILIIDVWKTSPFVALLILAGLQTIPDELYEAAHMDGAGTWQSFFYITVPMIRPALLIAVLFRTLDALRIYDIPAILTAGANDTTTLSVLVARAVTNELRSGYGSALSTLTFLILFLVALVVIRILMPQREFLQGGGG